MLGYSQVSLFFLRT